MVSSRGTSDSPEQLLDEIRARNAVAVFDAVAVAVAVAVTVAVAVAVCF